MKDKNGVKQTAHNEGIWAMVYLKNYDHKLFASGSWDKLIKIWNAETRECLVEWKGHEGMIYGLVNHRRVDSRFMVSSGYDNKMMVWEFLDEENQFKLIANEKFERNVRICHFEFIGNELLLFCSVNNTQIKIFNVHLE